MSGPAAGDRLLRPTGRAPRAGGRAQRRDPGPQLPARRGPGRRRLRRRLARAGPRGRRRPTPRSSSSAASTSWPRRPRSSRPTRPSCCPTRTPAARWPTWSTADELRALKAEHPGAAVVTYVNTTAAVKAESDVCCTSANAVEVVAPHPAGSRDHLRARPVPGRLTCAGRPVATSSSGPATARPTRRILPEDIDARPRRAPRREGHRPPRVQPRGRRPRRRA